MSMRVLNGSLDRERSRDAELQGFRPLMQVERACSRQRESNAKTMATRLTTTRTWMGSDEVERWD